MSFSPVAVRAALLADDLVVAKTDTIYGVCANALSPVAVAKLHQVRERDGSQGFIVLIPSIQWLDKIVKVDLELRKRLKKIWSSGAATSVILPIADGSEFAYLADRRDAQAGPTICFRLPQEPVFHEFLQKIDLPICAPSANAHGQPPAKNIAEAQQYFHDQVGLYVDSGGAVDAQPSRIVKFVKNIDLPQPDKFAGKWRVVEVRGDGQPHLEDFVVSRKRKLYKFAQFLSDDRCFDLNNWRDFYRSNFVKIAAGRSVVAEIGAGSALFLTELATRNPNKIYVALDRKSDRLCQGARLATKRNLTNIFYVWVEASKLGQVFAPHSVNELWLTFPDPFASDTYQTQRAELAAFYHDKLRFSDDARYAEHLSDYQTKLRRFDQLSRHNSVDFLQKSSRSRLTDERFLKLFAQILNHDGELNFKTDNAPLFEWSLAEFTKCGWHLGQVSRDLHRESDDVFAAAKIMTSYEKRFADEFLPISYAKFSRIQPSMGPAPIATTKD